MPSRIVLHLALILIAVLLAVVLFEAWRAERRDRDALQAELNATKQVLTAADSRQHDRDSQLVQTLASLAAEKRTVTTPAQIIHELPQTIPLPVPLTLQTAVGESFLSGSAPAQAGSKTNNGPPGNPAARVLQAGRLQPAGSPAPVPDSPQQKVFIPTDDLKPLYDFALDCKACQAKLAASQADLTGEKAKTAALTRERDDAFRVARGGSVLQRIARAAKWFAIGAAAGAIAAKTAH